MAAIVTTAQGALEGLEREGHQAFLGIPFARPPLGELRFRAPEAATPWSGVRPAREHARSAMQGTHPIPGMAATGPRSEDCLYLNVHTPAADGGRRPVLFWIHGGGFQLGSGSESLYDGGALARRGDVVVVSIHYRLGALGYLYLGAHGGDAWGATANAGQLDQIAALRWVRENIAEFGGDPSCVTIFGESAGSAAVATLLAMPAAQGLFARAVLQSGTANRLADAERAARTTSAFLAKLGLAGADASKLRELPVERLLGAQLALSGDLRFAPIVDGRTLPSGPLESVSGGAAAQVETIIGTNRDEVKLFTTLGARAPLDDAQLLERVSASIPRRARERAREIVDTYRRCRAQRLPRTNLDLLDAIQTDVRFRLPAIRLAEAQQRHQRRTFMYLFVWESPARRGVLGSCHALEMPFVFGTLAAPGQHRFAGSGPYAELLAGDMMDAWIAFARGGNPTHPGIGSWGAYERTRRDTMLFGRDSHLVPAPFETERALWDGVLS